jgi:phenol 2-monooxygenase
MNRADIISLIDLHKVYFDDESYNSGHGKAYECYGIEPSKGAVVIVRPDHC